MAINHADLGPEDLQTLSELAEKSEDEVLREAVHAYLERSSGRASANGRQLSKAERKAAFRRVAGVWSDMDVDAWLENIYASRDRSSRPVPEL
jgi:hypothetical protein